jgi:Protein of unknown function (DUF2283)
MKLNYFPDTDSLYIDLAHRPSVESREVSKGVVSIMTVMATWWGSTSITPAANWICANSSLTISHSKPQLKRKHKFPPSGLPSFRSDLFY